MTRLYQNEVYRAIQGEGPRAGTPTTFIRLHGCPVGCSWCDTSFTWDGSESGRWSSVPELRAMVKGLQTQHVDITGGEPTIQKALPNLIHGLLEDGYHVEVETAGIVKPPSFVATYNVSPKLPSANAKVQPNVDILAAYDALPGTTFKFVVEDQADFYAAKHLVRQAGLQSPVYLMPQARTPFELNARLELLHYMVLKDPSWQPRISNRLQVQLYGAERKK